jgi:hypothetical protein
VPALTVWSVCVGSKYPIGYVYALQEAVAKNLSTPHRFRCITEHSIPGVETVDPVEDWAGWWSKFNLFASSSAPSIYFDLDVVITGKLDYLVPYAYQSFPQLSAPANWARSGHGGIQSSVMAWLGTWDAPFFKVAREWPGTVDVDGYRTLGGVRYWGDQEYLWKMLGDRWTRLPRIYSYKYDCRDRRNLPRDMAVCVFHGEPKPVDVEDEWLLPSTSILRNHIKSSTGNGSKGVLNVTD